MTVARRPRSPDIVPERGRRWRRARRAGMAAVALAAPAGLAACSSGSGVTATQPPSQVADKVATVLTLPPAEAGCVRQGFADDAGLAAIGNRSPDPLADRATVDRFTALVRRCVPPATLAAYGVQAASAGLALNDQQRRCVEQAVAGLDEGQRDELVLVSVNDELADRVAFALLLQEEVTTPCHLDLAVGPATPLAPTDTGTDGAQVPPGGGITVER